MTYLIESRRQRPGDDPIFALNSEAKKRAAAGEDVVNATIGALLTDEGKLAVMPSVIESLAQVPAALAAGYAPIVFRLMISILRPIGTSAVARSAIDWWMGRCRPMSRSRLY